MNGYGIADTLIEAPIVTSFTRFGYEVRRRLAGWTPLDDYDLTGRLIVITGATSGLGYAAAEQFARCGATLVIVSRTADRNERTVAELTAVTGNGLITSVAADMGDFDQVRHLAERVLADHDRLDVLIHNAGALDPHGPSVPRSSSTKCGPGDTETEASPSTHCNPAGPTHPASTPGSRPLRR